MIPSIMNNSNLKEGQYYYRPHRNMWGVWKVGKKDQSGVSMDDFIMDFSTKIQAERFVYKMNGWTKPNPEDQDETEE